MQRTKLAKRLKRAFTITELVIVIAVIAILAAVLIPTFMNVTKKAQQSADNQLVKNLNTVLKAESVTDGQNATCYDAIQDAAEGGYIVDKITPTSDGDILWDSVNDCFVLYSAENGYQYVGVETPKTATADSAFFKIYNSEVKYSAEETKYSAYLGTGSLGSGTTTLTVKTGLDVGDEAISEVTYKATEAQTVLFRTNAAY